MTDSNEVFTFETGLPVTIFIRALDRAAGEWLEFESGPGHIEIPLDQDVYLRVKNIDDEELYSLVRALNGVPHLTTLSLSENRKVTDVGVSRLSAFPDLTHLNLSSCSITNQGMGHLPGLVNLEHLNISYCNRITDEGLRSIRQMSRLKYLDIQGCVKTTHAGVKRIERRGLTIHS